MIARVLVYLVIAVTAWVATAHRWTDYLFDDADPGYSDNDGISFWIPEAAEISAADVGLQAGFESASSSQRRAPYRYFSLEFRVTRAGHHEPPFSPFSFFVIASRKTKELLHKCDLHGGELSRIPPAALAEQEALRGGYFPSMIGTAITLEEMLARRDNAYEAWRVDVGGDPTIVLSCFPDATSAWTSSNETHFMRPPHVGISSWRIGTPPDVTTVSAAPVDDRRMCIGLSFQGSRGAIVDYIYPETSEWKPKYGELSRRRQYYEVVSHQWESCNNLQRESIPADSGQEGAADAFGAASPPIEVAVTDLKQKSDADRAIFWAGLFAGLVAALVIELFGASLQLAEWAGSHAHRRYSGAVVWRVRRLARKIRSRLRRTRQGAAPEQLELF